MKHDGDNNLFWVSIAWSEICKLTIIDGILDAREYIGILFDPLSESVSNLGIRDDFLL